MQWLLQHVPVPMIRQGDTDELRWSEKREVYTVKAMYDSFEQRCRAIDNSGRPTFLFKQVWLNAAPPISCFILWLINLDRLQTIDNLKRFGFSMVNIYTMCKQEEETQVHLFFDCLYVRQSWDSIMRAFGTNDVVGNSVQEKWTSLIPPRLTQLGRDVWEILLHFVVMLLWYERNGCIFEDIQPKPEKFLPHLKKELWHHLRASGKIFIAMAIDGDIESTLKSAEIRKPLVQKGDGSEKKHEKSEWMVYLSTLVVIWGSYEFGCCIGFSSPTQAAIREDVNLSLSQYSLFGSILTIGAMIGAITSGPIADSVGRKGALRTSVAFCLVGWLSIYFAKGALALDIGRLATGYGMGVFSYVVPVFIAEIAPKNLRGALTTLNQLMIVMGVSVSFIIGTILKWRTLALSGMIPCAVLLLGLFFIPESPRWLAKTGRRKEFEMALQKLRGKGADISTEAAEIQEYIDELEHLPKARMLDLFQRRYLRSVIIGVGLMVCQQLGGINGVCFYTSEIFASAGFPSKDGTIIYACLQVVVTALGAVLIDRAGRRALLLTSGTGLVLGCLITALSFYFKTHGLSLDAVPTLAVTGILVYIGSFSIGMGAIPWVVMSEVFPINIKGVAGSLATLVNWFGSWVCSYTFNYLMSWNSCGTFLIYAVVNVLSIIFIAYLVPETKGRTLEEIQAAINKY